MRHIEINYNSINCLYILYYLSKTTATLYIQIQSIKIAHLNQSTIEKCLSIFSFSVVCLLDNVMDDNVTLKINSVIEDLSKDFMHDHKAILIINDI